MECDNCSDVLQLIGTLADALEDNKVDDNKVAEILRKYRDVKTIILAIGYLKQELSTK